MLYEVSYSITQMNALMAFKANEAAVWQWNLASISAGKS